MVIDRRHGIIVTVREAVPLELNANAPASVPGTMRFYSNFICALLVLW